MDTEPLFQVEGLDEIISRDRPSLTNIWPEVLEDLAPSSLINVSGSSGAGKSMFLMELLARIIMRNDLNDSEAIYVDLDRKFSVFKLAEICTKMLGEEFKDLSDCVQSCVKPRMKKVHIITVENFDDSLFSNLESRLKENPQISMVLIDSLGEFVEIDSDTDSNSRNVDEKKEEEEENDKDDIITPQGNSANQSFPSGTQSSSSSSGSSLCSSHSENDEDSCDDVSKYVEKLKEIAGKYQVSIVSAVPTYVAVRERVVTVKVILTKVNEKAFHMKINDSKEVAFTIGFYGIQTGIQTVDPPQAL